MMRSWEPYNRCFPVDSLAQRYVAGLRVGADRAGHLAGQPPATVEELDRPTRGHVGPVDVVLGWAGEHQRQPYGVDTVMPQKIVDVRRVVFDQVPGNDPDFEPTPGSEPDVLIP